MSPAVKYTLGRLGLFVVLLLVMIVVPIPLNVFVKAMIALIISAVLSYFLLADWRNKMGEQLAGAATRRAAEKQRLRAALAGDEQAAADGDRASDLGPETDRASDLDPETDRASDLDPETDRVGAAEPAVADLEPEPADEKVDEKK